MTNESVLSDPACDDDAPVALVPAPQRRVRRRLRRIAAAALVLACLAAPASGWTAYRGLQAKDHLQRAVGLVQRMRQQIAEVNIPAATATLAALQRETGAARRDTDGTLWRLGQDAPVVGDDLTAVRTVAVALDDLARAGLPALVATAGGLDLRALTPVHGRISLPDLQAAAPRLVAVDTAVRQARDRLGGVAVDGLVPQLRTAVRHFRDSLDRAGAITATVARAATLLPAMLGGHGRRTYLVIFQNPAEIRATGGMPGAYIVIAADRGAIKIIDQGAAAGLGTFAQAVLPLPTQLRALYSDRLGTFPADINLSPHFPTAAALAREMYRVHSGRTVDGVIATDPVALSYLLRAIGPVRVPGGHLLTAGNAVRVLLSESYSRDVSPGEQDRYFAGAARATFQALTGRSVDPTRVLAALSKAAGERRILLWSARPAEEAAVTDTVLAGVLPASDGTRPTVGVFLNDGSGAKLDYYLTQAAELAVVGGCRRDGRREMTVRVTLGSTAPRSGLSPYVLGLGLAGDPYTMRTVVAVYSSTGGTVVGMTLDGAATSFSSGTDRRRSVARVAVDLLPGSERTLAVTLLTGVPATGGESTVTPRLWTTPGIRAWRQSVRSADGCPSSR